MDKRDFDGFEGPVVIEIEAGELANADFVVDVDAGVNFFARIAVGFEAVMGFEELDLIGVFCPPGQSCFFGLLVDRLFRSLLGLRKRKNSGGKEARACEHAQEGTEV